MGRMLPARPEAVGDGPKRRRSPRRAAVALLLVLAGVVGSAPGGAPASAGGTRDPRARRTALLLEAAALTDQLEKAEVGVVTAQWERSRTAARLATARDRVRARAVSVYMHGSATPAAALAAPQAYLDVVAQKEQEVMAGYRRALAGLAEDQHRAEVLAGDLRAARVRLARIQSELEATIAADDTRRAELARRADEARRAALARQAAADAAARARALGAAVGASPGGYAPTPLDPAALLPRHRSATERQLSLMGRIPFGPVPSAGALPAGLVPTGRRVEGNASWYGPGFNGRPTASGAIYDQEGWTVASKELPLGPLLVVTRGDRRVLLLVNDRGPYVAGRVLDLSAAAARALGVSGVASVAAEVVAAPD
jgi:rare lipoprotein A